jgi:hypothetical protein
MTIDGATITVGLSVVTTAAAALASYVTIRERVGRHDRSIENFGARLEASEKERTREVAELRATIADLDKRIELTADRADQSRPYRLPPPGGGGGTRP